MKNAQQTLSFQDRVEIITELLEDQLMSQEQAIEYFAKPEELLELQQMKREAEAA